MLYNQNIKSTLLLCFAVIALMAVLAAFGVYPSFYFRFVFLIFLWPLSGYIRIKTRSSLLSAIVMWIVCSGILILCNIASNTYSNTSFWWCIFPIIGIGLWPLCEIIYFGRK